MKILIVTRFFHPEITPRAFRAYELAKEFSRQGHDVTVLTTARDFNYQEIENSYGFKVEAIVKSEPQKLIGSSIIIKFIQFFLQHFFLYPFCLLVKSFSAALRDRSGYDLLISIAHPYPVHFGVALARGNSPSLCGMWVADCGDPLTGNKETRLPYPFYFQLIESWFFKKPDYISVPIPHAKDAYPQFCRDRVRVIPQGFDFSEFPKNESFSGNEIVTFAYAGNLSPGLRDPRMFLEFLVETDMPFKFVIYTKNKEFLLPYLEKLSGKFEIRDFVPREQLLVELSKMDFLLNLENKSEHQLPSKLIDYALIGRPILSIPFGKFDGSAVIEFLTKNYAQALVIEDLSIYNIENVAKSFLRLSK